MPSWKDGESSDEEEHSFMYISSDVDEDFVPLPAMMRDGCFSGIEPDVGGVTCNHGKPAERCIAFEGAATGRRFLACAEKDGKNCGLVDWIDPEWPFPMVKALHKLWDLYDETQNNLINANLESAFTIHNLKEEKAKVEENYSKLVQDVNELLEAQDRRVLDFSNLRVAEDKGSEKLMELDHSVASLKLDLAEKAQEHQELEEKYQVLKNLTTAQGNVIRKLKWDHLKEKARFTEVKRNLEWGCDDLVDEVETLKGKLKVIKEAIVATSTTATPTA